MHRDALQRWVAGTRVRTYFDQTVERLCPLASLRLFSVVDLYCVSCSNLTVKEWEMGNSELEVIFFLAQELKTLMLVSPLFSTFVMPLPDINHKCEDTQSIFSSSNTQPGQGQGLG